MNPANPRRSASLQTGVPSDRSSSLGWETGCHVGVRARTSIERGAYEFGVVGVAGAAGAAG
jgi:hypothetical protein